MALKDPTEYGFGQLGSMFTDTTDPIYPPKEMVFVAITFLEDSTIAASGGLTADATANNEIIREFIGDTVLAHDTGDTTSSGNCDGTALTITSANTAIKPGMTVESTNIPRSLTAPVKVKSYDGGTEVPLTRTVSPAFLANETITFFSDRSSGYGGDVIDASNTFPKGITIYGRWTSLDLASGSAIAYLGV
jgi:hypothetical protein